MEEMDTSYFCEFLKQNGISEHVVAVFREEDISGIVFTDLTEEDLNDMNLKKGGIKRLLRLQEKYRPGTQVSHAHYGYYHYLCCLRQKCGLSYLHKAHLYPNLV